MPADGFEIDRILQMLGFDGCASTSVDASEGVPVLHVGHQGDDEWTEVPRRAGQALTLTAREARLVLHLLPYVRAWASGEKQAGAESDVRWTNTMYRGVQVLEIRVQDWRPVRIAREQAESILLHESSIRQFARGG